MHLILCVFLIVIMSYFIMYFVSDDKNKGDQSINMIQHLSYNTVNNFFSITEQIGDPSKIIHHRYRRATIMSMYIKLL